MAEIAEVPLEQRHETKWRFSYSGLAFPGGPSFCLPVRDRSKEWTFFFKNEGNGEFSISGRQWNDFAQDKVNNGVVTLYSPEQGENFYRIRVKPYLGC